MKNGCEYTRKSLRKYLHGHLFKTQKMRIERHLRSCVVCRSEFEALRQAEDTRSFLKDITPPESVAQQVRESISGLARLKKIVYRPLWIAAILVMAGAVYYYVVTPRRLDVEIENIVKTSSSSTAPTTTVQPLADSRSAATATAVPSASVPPSSPTPVTEPAPAMKPLEVTITIAKEDEKTAVQRLNDVMRGHAQLRKNTFSDDVREISGSLTSKELMILFDRVGETAKTSYSRKRFQSFPSGQPIPFVMKLKTVTGATAKPAPTEKPLPRPAQQPAEAVVPPQPATAPTSSPAQ